MVALFALGAPVPQLIFGHDLIFLLDGGYRWNWGFLPHVDYYSPLGFLIAALVGWGATIGGSLANAVPAAMCLFTLTLLPAILYAAFSRMKPWVAAVATLMLVATALAPFQLRFESSVLTYCTVYNRWGYVLFALALLVVTLRPASRLPRFEAIDGFIAGSCVAFSLGLKITYGVLAALLFVSWIPIRPRTRAFYLGAFVAGGLWLLIFGLMLRWGFPQFIGDMALAFRARKGLGVEEALATAGFLFPDLCVLTALAALRLVVGVSRPGVSPLVEAARIFLTFACFALSAIAIVMSNAPIGELRESPVLSLGILILLTGILRSVERGSVGLFPDLEMARKISLPRGILILLLLLLLIGFAQEWTSRGVGPVLVLGFLTALWCVAEVLDVRFAERRSGWIKAFSYAALILVVAPVTARDVDGLVEAAKLKLSGKTLSSDQRFESGGLAGIEIRMFGGDPPLPTTYIGKVQDGLDLLARTGNADKTVHALEFANPFNMARLIRPSRTGVTCWQLDFVYSFEAAPAPERIFNPGELVMLPKAFGDGRQENLEALMFHYGAYLEKHFEAPIQSEQWSLFIPKVSM